MRDEAQVVPGTSQPMTKMTTAAEAEAAYAKGSAVEAGVAYPDPHSHSHTGPQSQPPTQLTADADSDEEEDNFWLAAKGQLLAARFDSWGVELRGIAPVPVEERTDTRYLNEFSLWFTMSVTLSPIITGMLGPLSYDLSVRDSSLTILFFSLVCAIPPAGLAILGPRTGLRQMVLARYAFGHRFVCLPVLLNLATVTGFAVVDAVVGGQTLAALGSTAHPVSPTVGIVVVALLSLLVSFFGYRVLHAVERWAWLPSLLAIVIATGCGGSHLVSALGASSSSSSSPSYPPATAPTILSFGGLVAGFLIPWAAMAADFGTYFHPAAPARRIFAYTYAGLVGPTVPLMVLGVAIGAAVPRVPAWAAAYDGPTGAGGVLAAMLAPAGGFGRFVVVLLALSVLGNLAAAMYSVALNAQLLLLPVMEWVESKRRQRRHQRRQRQHQTPNFEGPPSSSSSHLPPTHLLPPRWSLTLLVTAVVIPLGITAAHSFLAALENFIGLIGYWSAAFCAIVALEHLLFRRCDCASYDHAIWRDPARLPPGYAAALAGVACFALVVPCMAQVWFTGPIAERTGDVGFEVALVLAGVLYVPMRWVEIWVRGGL